MSQQLPTGWRASQLEDVLSALIDYRGKSPTKTTFGVPLITARIVKNGRIDPPTEFIASQDYAEWMRRGIPELGDVVITTEAPLGEVAQLTDANVALAQRLIALRGKPNTLDNTFLKFALLTEDLQNQLRARSSGTTVSGIRQSELRKVELWLPPFDEQRTIAGVLGALDEKIDSHRRTSQALGRLVQAIFRAWFLDFEPVRAKLAGAQSFPGMPQNAFDALPRRFVDSELGPIPEGWETRSLDQTGDFLNGLALQKFPPDGSDSDLPVVKIAELRKGNVQGSDRANGRIPSPHKILDGDLLFSWSGTLEVRFWFGGPGALNQHLFKVTSPEFPKWLMKSWIEQHLSHFRRIAASKATTMGHIKRGHLTEAKVVVPGKNTLEAADQLVGTLFDLFSHLQVENRQLAAMRDFLLPRLLSGQVRVKGDA